MKGSAKSSLEGVPVRIANRLFSVLYGATTVFLFVPFSRAAASSAVTVSERRTSFNKDWRFFKGEAVGTEQPQFDDSPWRIVRLPHDWAIEGPFDPKLNPHTGALPIFGTGWYRKSFTLPASTKGRYIAVEFDGAMNNAI
jgi:beta-galactosidase